MFIGESKDEFQLFQVVGKIVDKFLLHCRLKTFGSAKQKRKESSSENTAK
jgi:hypothetical protein